MTYYIHCDGSCYNHPDHNTMGYAAVLSKEFNPEMTEVIKMKTGCGKDGTNNIAEWLALITGMELMIEHAGDRVSDDHPFNNLFYDIVTDSNLITGQANGDFRVRNEKLRPYYKRFRALEKLAKNLSFEIYWTSRKNNKAADTYSKLANPYFKKKMQNELRTSKNNGEPTGPYEPGRRSIEDNGRPKGRSVPGV